MRMRLWAPLLIALAFGVILAACEGGANGDQRLADDDSVTEIDDDSDDAAIASETVATSRSNATPESTPQSSVADADDFTASARDPPDGEMVI